MRSGCLQFLTILAIAFLMAACSSGTLAQQDGDGGQATDDGGYDGDQPDGFADQSDDQHGDLAGDPGDSDPQLPLVSFRTTGQTTNESAGSVTIQLALSEISARDVTVYYELSGTATEGEDYSVAVGSQSPVTILASHDGLDLQIQIVDDGVYEPAEEFTLTLTQANDAVIGSPDNHTVVLTFSCNGTTYYVSNGGSDSATGLTESTSWCTIDHVNNSAFSPGDCILFRSGDTWREQLTIPSSGDDGNPITFGRYGSGNNPVIKSSEIVAAGDWVHENGPSGHIYSYNTRAVDDAWRNPHGAAEPNGKILDKFWYFGGAGPYRSPSSISNPVISELEAAMLDGFTWSPLNLGKIFIYSNANPGTLEVGKRTNCIDMNSREHITIDGIDLHGPGGGTLDYNQAPEKYRQAIIRAAGAHTTLRNSVIKNSMYHGVRGVGSNSLFENNKFEWLWGGIHSYNDARDVTVRGNVFTYIGAQIVSNGDRGVIGTWGNHWLVEYNTIESNGWRGQVDPDGTTHALDSAIIFCCGDDMSNPVPSGDNVVRYNFLKNIANGAITFDSGDNNIAYYNIIDGWNLQYLGYNDTSNAGGIRMNTWTSHSHPVYIGNKIFNNIITGGRDVPNRDNDAAIQLGGETVDMQIKNNLVYGNEPGVMALWANFLDDPRDNQVENNLFSVPSGDGVRWWGTYYDFQHIVSPTGCPNAGYWQCDRASSNTGIVRNNITDNPLFVDPGSGDFHLQPNSPAIDSGVDVGLTEDYEGHAVPYGSAPDIGPHEYTGSD